MLLPRLLTAIVGIPVILIAIKFGGIPFFILILAISCFALNEYFFLMKYGKYDSHPVLGYVLGIMLLLSIYLGGTKFGANVEGCLTAVVISLSLAVLFITEIIKGDVKGSIGRIGVTVFGIFAICWTLAHLLLIRDLRPNGEYYSYFLFLLIWIVDTAAYGCGVKFGKHRLAEKISPKKSIEGVAGGVVFGILTSLLLRKLFSLSEFSIGEIIVLGVVLTVTGYVSDLSESLIKRDVGLKDSDVLLPGHGGILDRFDSFLLTAPLFYYYLAIFHR
jgi:phosphatidate cytidylyltransferase